MMRKILIILNLFFLFFLFANFSFAYDCDNRPPECPSSNFPICQKGVFECNPPGCIAGMYLKEGTYVLDCAFPSNVTPPTEENYCGWDSNDNLVNKCSSGYFPRITTEGIHRSCQCWSESVPTPGGGVITTPIECSGPYGEGIQTALGCIPTKDTQEFIVWLLKSVIGIAGGIAFLLMLWGGFQIITSTGDPEKLNKGKEILTSAIIGLVVIVFSLFLLQLIGVKILQIPGFGTP